LQISTVHVKGSAQFTGVPAEQQCSRSLKIEQGLPTAQVQTSSPLQNTPSLQIACFVEKTHETTPELSKQTLLVQKFRSSQWPEFKQDTHLLYVSLQ
jgi:hypothetical protein